MHRNFLSFYDDYFDDVYRYVYYKVGNKWDADDVVSEIFRKAYEGYHTVNRNPKAWLFTVANTTLIDSYRKKKDSLLGEEAMEALTYPQAMLAFNSEESMDTVQLHQILSKLPKDELEMINLRYFADLSYGSMGKLLGKSESSVKMKVFRIIKKLREMVTQ